MEIVPISRRNISRQVYDQMLDNILNGVWPPGTKLPSENELTQMFGVSRVPIREALKKLSTMGITQTRQGEGSFVQMMTPGMFMNSLLPMLVWNRKSMMDILEYRRFLGLRLERGGIKLHVTDVAEHFTEHCRGQAAGTEERQAQALLHCLEKLTILGKILR